MLKGTYLSELLPEQQSLKDPVDSEYDLTVFQYTFLVLL